MILFSSTYYPYLRYSLPKRQFTSVATVAFGDSARSASVSHFTRPGRNTVDAVSYATNHLTVQSVGQVATSLHRFV